MLRSFSAFDGTDIPSYVDDFGDLDLPAADSAAAHARIAEAARRLFADGRRCFFVGGDHGCTGSLIGGLAAARPSTRLALINIDAHLDVREYADPAALSSGTPIRRALETAIAEPRRTAIVGLRPFANAMYYTDWARDRGVHLIDTDEIADRGAGRVLESLLDEVARDADAIYLTVDLDAVDGSQAPGVSAPGTGGLTTREVLALVRVVASHPRLVGADIMELSPPSDVDDRTARLAARLFLEVLRACSSGH